MPIIRSLDALDPGFRPLAQELLKRFVAAGIQYRVDETLRTQDVQEAYWLQSRAPLDEVNAVRKKTGLPLLSEKENKTTVTWTRESVHFIGKAIDVVPLLSREDGTFFVPWDYVGYAGIWKRLGDIGEDLGLDWGGAWTPLIGGVIGKDPPHYQKEA